MFRQLRRGDAERASGIAPIMFVLGRCALLFALAWAASVAGVDAKAAELSFSLRMENGRLTENMRLVRVTQGDVVRLQWSVDRPVTLHLHGYDIERRVEPGTVGEMTFTARATGRFSVHAHAAGERAGDRVHEEAPLLYVEVYPR